MGMVFAVLSKAMDKKQLPLGFLRLPNLAKQSQAVKSIKFKFNMFHFLTFFPFIVTKVINFSK